jgi:hypothetical protein
MRITEHEATRSAARFLESNGYLVSSGGYQEPVAPEKPPLYCAGAEWSVDHWTLVFAPWPAQGGPPSSLPLTLVRVDGATGEAKFFIK